MRNHTNGRLVTVTARVGVPASGTIMPDILFIAVKPLAPGEEGEFIGELPQKPRNNGLTAAPTGLRLDAYDRKGEFEKGLSAWLGE